MLAYNRAITNSQPCAAASDEQSGSYWNIQSHVQTHVLLHYMSPRAYATHLKPTSLNYCQAVTHSEYMSLRFLKVSPKNRGTTAIPPLCIQPYIPSRSPTATPDSILFQ